MGKRGRLPRKGRSRGSRKGRAKRGSGIRPPRVHFGFTNLKVTGFGGAPLLADAAKAPHGLPDLLGKAVSVKSRGRGATDAETMWAIVACLARGDGSLSDLNARVAARGQRLLQGCARPRVRGAGARSLWPYRAEWRSSARARSGAGSGCSSRTTRSSSSRARTVAHMVGAGRRTWVRYAKTNLRLDWLYEAMMACEARAPPAA